MVQWVFSHVGSEMKLGGKSVRSLCDGYSAMLGAR